MISLFLFVSVAVWITPSVSATEPTSTRGSTVTTTTKLEPTTTPKPVTTVTPSSPAPEPTSTTLEPSTTTTPAPTTTSTPEPSTTTAPEPTSTTSEPSTTTTPEPTTTTTTETTTKARPRQYGENCTDLFLCETSTVCNNDTHKCQCDSNHYLDTSKGKKVCVLKIALGKSCSANSPCLLSLSCTTRANDASSKCRIPAGSSESCNSSDVNCAINAECDSDNKCRIPAGSSEICTNSDVYCVMNAECDSDNKCKMALGKTCSANSPCLLSLSCTTRANDASSKCRIPAGSSESCTGDANCVMNAECDSGNKCRMALGKTCSANSPCLLSLSCTTRANDASNKCRIPAGSSESCTGDANCVMNAECDSDNKCKFPLGQACTAGSSQCLSPLLCSQRLSSSYKCRIPAGNTCNSDDSCVKDAGCEETRCKINLGKTCSTSYDYCKQGTKCVSTGGTNQCRKVYGSACSYEFECQLSNNQLCEAASSGGKKCLCKPGYFKQTSGPCLNENLLNASDINRTGIYQETSISVEWNKPTVLKGAQFYCMAVLTCGETNKTSTLSSNLYYTFNNVAPGSKCQVTIHTQTPRNNNYGPGNATNAVTQDHFYTKPAKPGDLTEDVYPGPDVTLKFYNSNGHVDTYIAEILSRPESKSVTPSNTATQSVVFTGLEQGGYYNVSIKATISMRSEELDSEINIQQFRVKPNSCGIVSDLNVSPGNRSAVVTWKIPQRTGGVMTGYKVQVENLSGQCVSEVMFLCTDCTSKPMQNEMVTGCATTKNKITNESELSNPSTVFRADLEGLLPDASYTVKVIPYNEEGEGLVDEKPIKTLEEPAEPLKDVKVEPFGTGQLNVSWIPGIRTGPTNYTITWTEETSIESGLWTSISKQHIVQGYANKWFVIPGLLSYWNYNVSVQVSAPKGFSPPMSQVRRTASSASEKLKSVDITQKDTAQSVDVSLVCPDERNRNGLITKFKYTSVVITGDTAQSSREGYIPVDSSGCHVMAHKIPVMAERTYEFTFSAVNSENQQGLPTSKNVTIEAKAPELESTEKFVNIPANPQTTTKSVQIGLTTKLLNGAEGNINSVGLRICDKATNCKPAGRGTNSIDYYNSKTWKKCKAAGFRKCEYTIKDPENLYKRLQVAARTRSRRSVSRRVARATEDYVTYVVGQNQTCESAGDTEFCNGPLPENREFIVIVWACTSGGCSEASDSVVIKTSGKSDEADSTITGAIVGGLLAFLAVVVIIAVVVIVYCRRRHHPQSSSTNQPAAFQVENILHEHKSVSLILYPARIDLLHRNSNLYFRQEYQELLQKEKEFTYTSYVGKLDINRVKNQCADILPYDYTRVKLYCQDDLGQDYINASYIMGLQSPCDYLATQGPLVSTIPDFWRMVLDHRSPVIVMLSDLTEHGQSKVNQYWPRTVNVPVHYGKVTVTMTSLATLPKYTLRNFSVSMNTQDAFKVSHFQLVGWKSQGSIFSLDDVADTLYDVSEMTASSDGPVTVHCSNGTARTCSFIALDTLRTHVVQHALGEDVDVFHALLNIIKCRPHMIQSERQYMFIHDVLRVMVERKMRNESGRREMYENIGGRNSSVYESTYAYVPEHNVYEVIGNKTATSTTGV